jgi:hypothetical protein
MWNGMECGTEYGMEHGIHLVYLKRVNLVAMPINYPLGVLF